MKTFSIPYQLTLDINHGIILQTKNSPTHLILAKVYLCLSRDSSDNRIEFQGSTDKISIAIKEVMVAVQDYLLEQETHWSNGCEFKNVKLVPDDKAEQVCSVLAKGVQSISISLRGPQDYYSGVKIIVCGSRPTYLVRRNFVGEDNQVSNCFVIQENEPPKSGYIQGYWFLVEGEYIKR